MNLLKKLLTTPLFGQRTSTDEVSHAAPQSTALVKYRAIEQAQQSINTDWDTQDLYSVVDRLSVICTVVGGFITRYNTLEKTIDLSPYSSRHTKAMRYASQVFRQNLGLGSSGQGIYRCEVQVMQARQANEAFFREFLRNLGPNLANRTHIKGAGAVNIALHIQAKERFIADVNSLTTYAKGIISATLTIQKAIETQSHPQTRFGRDPEETVRGYRQALAVLEIKIPLPEMAATNMLRRLESFRVYVIESMQPY